MKTVGLDYRLWLSSLLIASFTLVLGFIIRAIPVRLEPWEKKSDKIDQGEKKRGKKKSQKD